MPPRIYEAGDEPVEEYRLVEFLGRGGFGEVWKARGPGDTEVALKIIRELSHEKGGKELRALQLLKTIHHPNLVPVQAYWLKQAPQEPSRSRRAQASDDRELIIAMGLGEMSLFDRMEDCQSQGNRGIPRSELLNYISDSARALDYLNSRHSIQHCDVKPQNILIVGNAAQLCDFGLARAVGADLRQTTSQAMSIAYGAPEILAGDFPTDGTDQYSLAVSYYELLTGELPFSKHTAAEIYLDKKQGNLDLHFLDEAQQEVIRRATALRPEDRYEKTIHMVRALEACCDEEDRDDQEGPSIPPTATIILPRSRDTGRIASDTDAIAKSSQDTEIVPGYCFEQLLDKSDDEEVWSAKSQAGMPVAMVVRKITSFGDVDLEALKTVFQLRHDHLTDPIAYWILDGQDTVITDSSPVGRESSPPAKLVIAGALVGCTLQDRLDDCQSEHGGGISPTELLEYMAQVASAVDFVNEPHLHPDGRQLGIQHCAISPANLVLKDGHVRLANLSRVVSLEGDFGTCPSYASARGGLPIPPETRSGHLSRWSDQYALAISYIQLRTGCSSTESLESSILPHDEMAVLERALADDPNSRFGNCADLVDQLRSVFSGQAAPSEPTQEQNVPTQENSDDVQTLDYRQTIEDSHLRRSSSKPAPAVNPTQTILLPGEGQLDTRSTEIVSGKNASSLASTKTNVGTRPFVVAAVLFMVLLGLGAFGFYGARAKFLQTADENLVATEYLVAHEHIESLPWWLAPWVDQDKLNAELIQAVIDSDMAVPVNLVLELSEPRLDVALGDLNNDQDPTEPLDDVQKLLERVTEPVDGEFSDRVADARYQYQLLRARSYCRLDRIPSTDVNGCLAELRRLVEEGAKERASQHATRMLLSALVQYDAAPDNRPDLLQRLKAYKSAAEGIDAPDDWSPNSHEQDLFDDVRTSYLEQERQAIAAAQPRQGIELAAVVLEFAPKDYAINELNGEHHIVLSQFEEALGTLRTASENAPSKEKSRLEARVGVLAALTAVRSSDNASDVRGELATFFEQRKTASIEMLHAYIDRLLEFAGDTSQQPDEIRKYLRTMFQEPPADRDEILAGRYETVQENWKHDENLQTRQKVLLAAETPRDPADFEALYEFAGKSLAEADGYDFVLPLVQIEADIEREGGNVDWDAARSQALLSVSSEDQQYEPYQAYVRALIEHRATGTNVEVQREAAELISSAFSGDSTPILLSADIRRSRAAEILVQAADPRIASPASTVESLLGNPFREDTSADVALRWLNLAVKLTGEDAESSPARKSRALASFYAENADPNQRETARELLQQVLNEKSDSLERPDIPWLHADAQVLADPDPRAALKRYATIVQLGRFDQIVEPKRVYEAVVEPGIATTQNIPNASPEHPQKDQFALLYGARGRLFERFPTENWGSSGESAAVAYGTAIRSYTTAIKYNPSAEYYAGRGSARLSLARSKYEKDGKGADYQSGLDAAMVDADEAIKTSAEHAAGHSLRGRVFLFRSRVSSKFSSRAGLLEEAAANCRLAVGFGMTDQYQLVHTLIDLSTALVERVSYETQLDNKAKTEILSEGRDHALQGTKLGDQLEATYRDWAYRALGNAYEDLAGIAKETPSENYQNAVNAFTDAIDRFRNTANYMARGRCRFKAVNNDVFVAKDEFPQAIADLNEAIQRDPRNGQAHYWLGRIYFHPENKDNTKAYGSFSQAIRYGPTSPKLYSYLGRVAKELSNSNKVDDSFSKAIKLARTSELPYHRYVYQWAVRVDPWAKSTTTRKTQLAATAKDLKEDPAAESKFFVAVSMNVAATKLSGSAFRKKVQEVLKLYESAIAAPPQETNEDSVDQMCYYRYTEATNRYLTDLKSGAEAKSYIGKHGEKIVEFADKSASLAEHPYDKTMAQIWQADTISKVAGLSSDSTKKDRYRKSTDAFTNLIDQNDKHPLRWYWLKQVVSIRLDELPDELDTSRDKRYLQEARELADAKNRAEITRLMKELNRLGKDNSA